MAQDKRFTPKVQETAQAPVEPEVTAPVPENPATESTAPDEVPAKSVTLRSKVGYMVHPFKNVAFSGEKPLEFAAMDSWLQAQLEAGKLELVQ